MVGLVSDEQILMVRRLAWRQAKYKTHRTTIDADDYFQGGFLAVWEAVVAIGAPLHDPQVYVVARRAMMGMDKRCISRRRTLDEYRDDPNRPTYALGDDGTAIDVRGAVSSLDDDERAVAEARYWRDVGSREIAKDGPLRSRYTCRVILRSAVRSKDRLIDALIDYAPPHLPATARKYGKSIDNGRPRLRKRTDRREQMRKRYLKRKAERLRKDD